MCSIGGGADGRIYFFAGAVTVTAAVAVAFTVHGLGPIAYAAITPEGQTLLLQSFFAVALLLTIPVSAIISERNRLEAALISSERQFRLMAEASPAGILQCRLDGTPLYLNARWTALTGTTLDDIRLAGWESVVADDARGRATLLWHQARGRIAEGSDCLPCVLVDRPAGWAG